MSLKWNWSQVYVVKSNYEMSVVEMIIEQPYEY